MASKASSASRELGGRGVIARGTNRGRSRSGQENQREDERAEDAPHEVEEETVVEAVHDPCATTGGGSMCVLEMHG
jgi:hypothetical protein